MAKYRVAVLPGDGVGKEVIDAAMIVLKKMKTFADVPSDDIAVSLRIIIRKGARNIVQQAFEYAKKYGYASV